MVRSTGEEVRDFIFVDDAVRALVFLGVELPQGCAPDILNLCSGIPTRIGDLARRLLRLDSRSEHELHFEPGTAANPIGACVGDPTQLAVHGVAFPPISAKHLVDTLSWIRNSSPQ